MTKKAENKKQKVIVTSNMIFHNGARYRKGATFFVDGDMPAGCEKFTTAAAKEIASKDAPQETPETFSEMAHRGRPGGGRAKAGQSIN